MIFGWNLFPRTAVWIEMSTVSTVIGIGHCSPFEAMVALAYLTVRVYDHASMADVRTLRCQPLGRLASE